MNNQNNFFIVGHLGGDPELQTVGESSVMNLSIAVDASYKKGEEKIEKTKWFRVAFWGKQAETLSKFLQKGQMVLVWGELESKTKEIEGKKYNLVELKGTSLKAMPKKEDPEDGEAG